MTTQELKAKIEAEKAGIAKYIEQAELEVAFRRGRVAAWEEMLTSDEEGTTVEDNA